MSCIHRYLQMSLASEEALQLSNQSVIEGEIDIATKKPSDYKIETQSFERKPTAGIQEIAEKPFTVNKIDKFKTKANEEMVIIETDETFTCEYKEKPEDVGKIKGQVNRFFASPLEIKKFFSDDSVIEDVNENGNKIKTMIEKVPFTAEEIKRDAKLKGKTHYVFKEL